MGTEESDGAADSGDLLTTVVGDPSHVVNLAGQFYRGEVDRMTTWRTRLDQTTNWAVVLLAAILTFAFSSRDNPHYVLLVGSLAIGAFLVVESQRYQEYDAWRTRVRLLQQHLLAGTLAPEEAADSAWRERLAADLRDPELTISLWQAIGHRLKRVYFLLLSVLLSAWVLRVSVFRPDESWGETASIATIPGSATVAFVGGVYLVLGALAGWSIWQNRVREFENGPAGAD